jgi:GTPase SAR1 family protein
MERVVFLVGGTGSGKTTLINSLTNYIYDIVQSDYFRFQVVSSEDERRHNSTLQSSSQTKTVIAYSFHQTRLDYVLTLVDTPGFGDTQGANVDKQTIGYIRSYFEQELADGINRLYAICLVIKSNETRLTAQFVSELNQVASLFGSDIQSNMFAMITFHDWSGDAPVLTAFRDHETIKFQSYFYINNSGIFAMANTNSHLTPTQELFWNKSINSLQQFLNCLQVCIS